MNKFTWTKKRTLIGAVAICIVAISGLTLWLNSGHVAEAALLNPHPGLVGWWRFDEGTGTIASDSSGNGNNGTIHGATWVTGKYSDALSFDGSGNYVDVPYADLGFPVKSNMTITAWVYPAKLSGEHAIVAQSSSGVLFEQIDNQLAFWANVNNPSVSSSFSVGLAQNSWNFVAVTYNDATGSVLTYIGSSINSKSLTANQMSPSSDTWIGKYASDRFFNGSIDDVHIYNRALSQAEIQADLQGGPDFSTNLLAKVPKGTTQVITTLSWQGIGSINVTIVSPSQSYTESMLSEYQKTSYSTSNGMTSMLNIKRLSVSVNALSSDQNWYVVLTLNNVNAYQVTVEVQK